MPTDTYSIDYKANVDQAINAIDRYINKVKEADQLSEKLKNTIKDIGSNTQGLTTVLTALQQLVSALSSTTGTANATKTAVAGVGQNTGGMNSATTKAAALQSALNGVAASATAAAAATASIQAPAGGIPGAGGAGAGAGAGAGGLGGMKALGIGLGIGTARKLARGAGQAFSAADQKLFEQAAQVQEFRASLNEIATLEHKAAPDNATMLRTAGVMMQTGASAPEAVKFMGVYEGATGAAVLKHAETGGRLGMTEATAQALEPEALTFGQRTGMDAETTGKLFATVGLYQPIPDVETAMREVGKIHENLNVLGVGTMKKLSPGIVKLMGQLAGPGGKIPDPVEIAAFYAAETTKTTEAQAATDILRTKRGLEKLGRAGAFGIGIDDEYDVGLGKVAQAFQGKTSGEQLQMLIKNKLAPDAEAPAMLKQMSLRGVVHAQMKTAALAEAGKNSLKNNALFRASPEGQANRAAAKAFVSDLIPGMAAEAKATRLVDAQADLTASRGIDTTATNLTDFAFDNTLGLFSSVVLGKTNKATRIEAQAIENLQREFGMAGVNKQQFKNVYGGVFSDDAATSAKAFGRAQDDLDVIQGRGGQGRSEHAIELLKKLVENTGVVAEAEKNAPAQRGPGNGAAVNKAP